MNYQHINKTKTSNSYTRDSVSRLINFNAERSK